MKVAVEYKSGAEIADAVKRGDPAADLVLSNAKLLSKFEQERKIEAPSVALAKDGFGVVVRRWAEKPTVKTDDDLKRVFLDARSVASGDPEKSASGKYLAAVLAKLGIAREMTGKIKFYPSGTVALKAVDDGAAQYGFEVTTAANGQGTQLCAELPADLQQFSIYAGAVLASATHRQDAKALLTYLASDNGRAIFNRKGFVAP